MAKDEYPKSMTIRYDRKQEQQIQKLMLRLDEKTMSKAFLKAPTYIEGLINKNGAQSITIEQLLTDNKKLAEIVNSWACFYNKIDSFFNRSKPAA